MLGPPLLILLAAATAAAAAAVAAADSGKWITLNDGMKFPAISLGTCCGSKPDVGLLPWLKAGGIGIDTSIDYRDEAVIGNILKQSGVQRSDVYITTKVTAGCGQDTGDCTADPNIALASVRQSLKNLGVDVIDMILLHRPCQQFAQKCSIAAKLTNCSGPSPIADPAAANNALWKGLQDAKALGLVRSIGVSNYFAGELAALEGEVPAINQCEMSVQGYDNATIAYCTAHNILYESYGAMRGCPFSDAAVAAIAKAHTVSTAQVCLRWALQRGVAIASGTGANASTAASYAAENLAIFNFTLTGPDMAALNSMQLTSANQPVLQYPF